MKVELLAPAGNYAKLKTALRYGADAVYVGGKNFSLRSFADNFSQEELRSAVVYVHERGKKIYVTLNIYARNADFGALREYVVFLHSVGVDAVLVSDPGVVQLIRTAAPRLPLHISTQANTTNRYAVQFWAEQGVSRVVLARELSVFEIAEIHEFCPEVELEAFVHGAMCISYSGRCLLSDYLDGRSSNRGACVQACRWGMNCGLFLPVPQEEYLPVEEDGRGTYILNSKDLNLLPHLSQLRDAGVSSFKIEGRMKSEYYLATVVNAYRRAMDGGDAAFLQNELHHISHRAYTTAYAFGKNTETVGYDDSQTRGRSEYVANVLDWREGIATVEMRNRFFEGDVLQSLSPAAHFGATFAVCGLRDACGNPVRDAKLVQGRYSFYTETPLAAGDFYAVPADSASHK